MIAYTSLPNPKKQANNEASKINNLISLRATAISFFAIACVSIDCQQLEHWSGAGCFAAPR